MPLLGLPYLSFLELAKFLMLFRCFEWIFFLHLQTLDTLLPDNKGLDENGSTGDALNDQDASDGIDSETHIPF